MGAILAAVVAFGVAPPPPPLASLAQAFAHMDITGLPPLSWYHARDGAMFAYRAYPAEGPQVAVLIHGSTGQGEQMNALARTLNGTGATVYALDIRGTAVQADEGTSITLGSLTTISRTSWDPAVQITRKCPTH